MLIFLFFLLYHFLKLVVHFFVSETATLWALTVNTSLLCLFMFQHSAMTKPLFKRALYSVGLQVAERSIYVISTSFILHVSLFFKVFNPLKQ